MYLPKITGHHIKSLAYEEDGCQAVFDFFKLTLNSTQPAHNVKSTPT